MSFVSDEWRGKISSRAAALLRRRVVLHDMDMRTDDVAEFLVAVIADNCQGNHEVPVSGGGLEMLRRDDFGAGLRCVGVDVEGRSGFSGRYSARAGDNLLDTVAWMVALPGLTVSVTEADGTFRFVVHAGDAVTKDSAP